MLILKGDWRLPNNMKNKEYKSLNNNRNKNAQRLPTGPYHIHNGFVQTQCMGIRAVIISGGEITDYNYIKTLINEDDFIICADSGYDHAVKMDITPAALVGDFDSIEHTNFQSAKNKNIDIVPYPAEKDYTDTEIALEYAREKGFTNFLFLAAYGTRIDHTMGNIMLLKNCLYNNEKAQLANEYNTVFFINSKTVLHGKKGDTVSLIPITDCYKISTHNLKYPLFQEDLLLSSTHGISNIMTENTAEISIEKGIMMINIVK